MVGAPRKDACSATDLWKDVDLDQRMQDVDILKTPTLNNFVSTSNETTPVASTSVLARPAIVPAVEDVAGSAEAGTSSARSTMHVRRQSRHARKDSVSTRKESMEIMGGLSSLGINPALEAPNSTSYTNRNSRRISSQRWSGLQPASVLFGGSADSPNKRASLDWRNALAAETSDVDGDDRLTALEKLEGRSRRHSRQTSVQLPSFDEVHGDDGMDKRASQDLLDSNAKTTSSDRTMLSAIPFAAPSSSPLPAPSSSELTSSADSNTGEGLGTLMEEEEEEDDSASNSPVRERGAFDFTTEEERRRRKEAEQEVVKRTRRGSLTPAPLKLKSRPASLFMSHRTSQTVLAPSSSLPSFASSQSEIPDVKPSSIPSARSSPAVNSSGEVSQPASDGILSLVGGFSMPDAQRKLAEARLAGSLPDPTGRSVAQAAPTLETKRSWRASMPSAQAMGSSTPSGPMTSGAPIAARQGMRALRLASNLSSRTDTMQHRARDGSSSSHASSASQSSSIAAPSTAGSISTPGKRGSLLYNTSSTPLDGSPANVRRSSIQYRASPIESPATADLSTSSSVGSLPSGSPTFATARNSQKVAQQNSSMGAGVPMNVFDELKSKHQRDIALLDEARRNISRLELELTSEAERTRREYDELEHWSAEEKRSLGVRIEHLEASIVEVTEVREAREEHHRFEVQKLQEAQADLRSQLNDAQAERDMLRDDIDGWRSRCSDLERSLRSERLASPLLGATPRDGSVSPIMEFDAPPPPQAIKLLKDMRQQIIVLARTLEQEREQHARSQAEAEDLRSHNARLATALHDQSLNDTTAATMLSDSTSSPAKSIYSDIPSSSLAEVADAARLAASSSQSSLEGGVRKKRNHVFAYDSSMESGAGSASVGSASVSTQQTSEYHGDQSDIVLHTHDQGKDDEAFIADVQADLVGLGMSSLDTLAEEEEAMPEHSDGQQSPLTAVLDVQDHHRESFDIEAGRPSDLESIAPSTPALEHHSPGAKVAPLPVMGIEAKDSHGLSTSFSAASSTESHAEPPTPLPPSSNASQDTITTPSLDKQQSAFGHYADHDDSFFEGNDDEDNIPPVHAQRPEFLREWSFEQAMSAVQTKKENPSLRIGTQNLRKMPMRRQRNKLGSIDDFFGIMSLDNDTKLPPLPTPEEALDMPPVQLLGGSESYSSLSADHNRRMPSNIRPPVPKSSRLYGQSLSGRSSGLHPSDMRSMRSSSNPQLQASNELSSAGGGMFSRVASLTSAFSGLSGYLMGTNTGVENDAYGVRGGDRPFHHNDVEAGDYHASMSWAVTRRQDGEEA